MAGPKPIVTGGHGQNQGIYDIFTVPEVTVGTRAYLLDGRVFYYVFNHTTTALTAGELLVTATVTPNHHDQTVNAAGDFTLGRLDVTLNPGATAIVLQEYEEGMCFFSDGTGEPQIFKIKSHAGNAGSAQSAATLFDPVDTGAAGATTISLVRNKWMNPQQSNTTVSEIPIGVPLKTITAATTAATATAKVVDGQYGWVQTWGPCPVLCDEAVTAEGVAITIGSSTAGAVEQLDDTTASSALFPVGYNMTPLVDNEHQLIDLRIMP